MGKVSYGYFGRLTEKVNAFLNGTKADNGNDDDREMLRCVQNAMEEWCQAEQYFQNVSEPELVDYAIFRIEATKKRYMYLLKKAKDMGVKMDCFGNSG